jgi:glycosyltransferase involved in cell wall biosynthesis
MYEASTGGLTLLEAYRLGKPVLMSNSYYQGGQDYFGDKAEYFQYDSYSNFKAKLKDMWENPRKVNIEDAIIFTDQYTPEKMAESVLNRLKELKK